MDEAQIAEIQAAITKAKANEQIADAEALQSYLDSMIKPHVAEEKPMVRTLVFGLGGAGSSIFGGGKVADPTQRDPITISRRETIKSIKETDDRWEPMLLPLGEGVLVATKLN
jgi:hypothetical protein